MASGYLTYNRSLIHYHRYGKGPRLLFCLHGYAQTVASFAFLEPVLGELFTIVVPELPYHGETKWNEERALLPGDVVSWIRTEMLALNINTCTLMGYSIGARVAISVAEKIPANIDQLIVAAPDVLPINRWYTLATKTRIGSLLFALTMKHPAGLRFLVKTAAAVWPPAKRKLRFALWQISTQEKRNQLHAVWMNLRYFRPNWVALRSLLIRNRIETVIITGMQDEIVSPRAAQKMAYSIEGLCIQVPLQAGHHFMNERFVDKISAPLLLFRKV